MFLTDYLLATLLKVFLPIYVPLALMQVNTHPMTSDLVIILVCLGRGGRNPSDLQALIPPPFHCVPFLPICPP